MTYDSEIERFEYCEKITKIIEYAQHDFSYHSTIEKHKQQTQANYYTTQTWAELQNSLNIL